MLTMTIFLGFGIQPAHADDTDGISIQNVKVQPSTIKVGDTFTVTATLVNNSTVPIVLEGGTCVPLIEHVPFFTVMLDSHTKIKSKNLTCAGVGLSQILNPGKNLTGTSPDSTLFYIATEPGTANVTVTFHYSVKNQTDPTQANIEQTISKSFLFTIYDNKTSIQTSPRGGPSFTFDKITPLKQFKSGIRAEDIKCSVDHVLTIKSEDGSPTCVKPDTAKKLIQRGWAIEKLDPRFTSMDLEVYGSYNPGTLSGHFLKGSLSSIEGPISNGNVTIYVNGILMGQTVTDLSGCFQFNSWDDKKLSAQINETRLDMEQKGVLDGMNLRVVANYSGNENHGATNVTKQSYLYLWALPLPPPNYQTTISPSVLNVTQEYPIHFELMVKPFTTYSNVDMMKLSVGQMPCGVTDAISYNKGDDRVSTDHPGIFNVTLNTSSYTPTGTYWIMITQNTSGLSNPNIDHDITEFALKVLPKDN